MRKVANMVITGRKCSSLDKSKGGTPEDGTAFSYENFNSAPS